MAGTPPPQAPPPAHQQDAPASTEMQVDPAGPSRSQQPPQPPPPLLQQQPQHAPAYDQPPTGQFGYPPFSSYQPPHLYGAPQNAPAWPSNPPLHPSVQGTYAHAYASPYGAPAPNTGYPHPTVPSSSLASSSSTSPVAMRPSALPAGMPPLMPIPGLTWAPVPENHLLVAHTTGCVVCGEFLRHYQAAMNDQSFRDAMTSVQTRLQAQFWAHFEEHVGSREGETRREHERRVGELEQQLRTAREEAQTARNEAQMARDEAQTARDETRTARQDLTNARQTLEHYRSERDRARDDLRLRDRARQSQPNQARLMPPLHPDFPESYNRPVARPTRSDRDASPRRAPPSYSTTREAGSSYSRIDPRSEPGPSWTSSSNPGPSGTSFAEAGPSRTTTMEAGPSRTTSSTAGPARTPQNSPPAPSTTLPETPRSARQPSTPGERTLVSYRDLSDLSSDDAEGRSAIDHDVIRRKTERQRGRAAMRGERYPPTAQGFGRTVEGRDPPPRIDGWPYDSLRPPVDSDPRQTDHWYNYVPVTEPQARVIMDAASRDMGQARARVVHLLQQVSDNPALIGVQGMRILVDSWRNPDRRPYLPTVLHPAAYNPPNLEPADTTHLPPPTMRNRGREILPNTQNRRKETRPERDLHGPRRKQPRSDAPPSEHREWMRSYPDRIPAWMSRDQDGGPTSSHVEFFVVTRQSLRRDLTPGERARWIELTEVLFSVPRLYRHILERWHLEPRATYAGAPYTRGMGDNELSLFHVAWWHAQRGVSFAMAERMERPAFRARAHREGRDHTQLVVAFNGINSVTDVTTVPPLASLNLEFAQTAAPPTTTPTAPTVSLPGQSAAPTQMEVDNQVDSIASTPQRPPDANNDDPEARQEGDGEPSGAAAEPADDPMDK